MSTTSLSKKSKKPERSLTFRLTVLAAMLTPLLALARARPDLWPHVIIAAMGIGLGHWYSYTHLDRNIVLVQTIMFMLIHVALAWLFVGLFIGAAVPQAQFAIFAQAITSFDLRYRRSLWSTVGHSLANLYVAATLSRTLELAVYLILFAALVLAALYIAGREDGLNAARLRPKPWPARPQASHRRSITIFGFGFGVSVLLGLVVAFLFTPRYANNPIVPPFTLNIPMRGGVQAEIINPGVPLVQINGWNDGTGDYFYGFDTTLDLRYRGGLSNAIVMYVRSPSRSYWRSHSYDNYTGVSWTQSDKSLRDVYPGAGVHFVLLAPLGGPVSGRQTGQEQRIVQSFTIAREQPNLVFAAYRPMEIFILADQISVDSGDGLRLPDSLKPGFTYSVISYRPEFDPEQLRRASTHYPTEIARRYLQLPGNISLRVRNLAGRLTAAYPNNYDKVMALNHHLLSEYAYNYFPPPHPPGAEVVDTFLFEDKQGVCEQYVTALVVMARTLGIPARLVTGYGAGTYNPITNYYEVRLSHAHSWAEVYFPGHGWVPFDPTPGWTPQPYPTPVQNWLFANQGKFFGLDIPQLPVEALVPGKMSGLVFSVAVFIIALILAGLTWVILSLIRQARRPPTQVATAYPYTRLPPDPTRRLILKLYQQGINLLRRIYRSRQPWEALSEYAEGVGNMSALNRLTEAAEVAAYRTEPPDRASVVKAKKALTDLENEIEPG
ncbi:MAG: transglutaminase family protein [Anaerolineae bacterium]|nr:transglutaminase family protein [Anaerolineae bacterium]